MIQWNNFSNLLVKSCIMWSTKYICPNIHYFQPIDKLGLISEIFFSFKTYITRCPGAPYSVLLYNGIQCSEKECTTLEHILINLFRLWIMDLYYLILLSPSRVNSFCGKIVERRQKCKQAAWFCIKYCDRRIAKSWRDWVAAGLCWIRIRKRWPLKLELL